MVLNKLNWTWLVCSLPYFEACNRIVESTLSIARSGVFCENCNGSREERWCHECPQGLAEWQAEYNRWSYLIPQVAKYTEMKRNAVDEEDDAAAERYRKLMLT